MVNHGQQNFHNFLNTMSNMGMGMKYSLSWLCSVGRASVLSLAVRQWHVQTWAQAQPMLVCKYLDQNGSPAMLATKRSRRICCTQVRESTLALKLRADITRSPRQGYQWPQKRSDVIHSLFLKPNTIFESSSNFFVTILVQTCC